MHFFPAERKATNGMENMKHEKTFNCFEISHTREAEIRDTFQWGLESDTIPHFLKVEVILPIIKTK